ncbi:hypothetical protein [Stenotrophomonas sp. 57]|uniref:hypothetical protein n=1 Tax=Stenotrophomonas sp. 57 TaxID=3051119 RepID=UPI00256F3A4C|nr:hypothetical protein [Stenotrophomonas sp. 57]
MSNDNKTLADVQPGGRVRLGDGLLQKAYDDLRYYVEASPCELAQRGISREDALDIARESEAALSAQTSTGETLPPEMRFGSPDYLDYLDTEPSPGGQGEALPPLPPKDVVDTHLPTGVRIYGYTAEQMQGYARAALAARQPVGETFQSGVAEWMGQCFLPSLYSNMTERGDRLLEEVLELLQAHGYDKARVPTLVDYVFGRPVGDPAQEVGGVMVTLAGYCWVAGLDMHAAGDAELARITQPEVMAKIRAKQEAKNALHFDTPLPGNAATPPAQADQEYLESLDRALGCVIDERDRYHEMADDLAGHIATITGVDIGEHSSANCPWRNAIEAAEEYKPAQAVDDRFPGGFPDAIACVNEIEELAEALHTQVFGHESDGESGATTVLQMVRYQLAEQPAQAVDLAPRPMATAPHDGTMVRLLVQFKENATEDTSEPTWTIGACNDDNVGEDERIGWQFAGWCWTHDHFTEGKGTPVGWLPMIDSAQAVDLGAVRDIARKAFSVALPGSEVDAELKKLLAVIDGKAVGNG